jgi:hypothetical protein
VLRIDGRDLHLHPVELTHIPRDFLRDAVCNMESERDHIVAAIDLVFTGI